MILEDPTLPNELQPARLIQAIADQPCLGAIDGKPAFGYVMTISPLDCGGMDSITKQLRMIHQLAKCNGYSIEPRALFMDVASTEFSTSRSGYRRLRIACISQLFDGDSVFVHSPDCLCRMPDELTYVLKEWEKIGINLIFYVGMPTVALSEVDRFMHS